MKQFLLSFVAAASLCSHLESQTLVKDINPGSANSMAGIIGELPSGFLFNARTPDYGTELWISDGTSGGTVQVKDIYTGTTSSGISTMYVKMGSSWYFVARTSGLSWSLWKTDGTEAGTMMLKDLGSIPVPQGGGTIMPIAMAASQNAVFLSYNDPSSIYGQELWKTDGTIAGTVMVKDINATPYQGSNPSGMTSYGNYMYFFANDGVNGNELWRSDGTEAGTTMVKDINPGSSGSFTASVPSLFVFNNYLYFGAEGSHTEGVELWRTDGTSAGTVLFKDVNAVANASSYPALLGATSSYAIFRASDANGAELWVTDGTNLGTVMLKDINPGSASSLPYGATTMQNKIFFKANDAAAGTELWITDGSPSGTKMLKDIYEGTTSSYPYPFTLAGNRIFFAAQDMDHGVELWTSDGTENGTKLYADINTGSDGSLITSVLFWNNKLYFQASRSIDAAGVELYQADISNMQSVHTYRKQQVMLYPNPARAGSTIILKTITPETEITNVKIYSMDGRCTGVKLLPDNSICLPENISAGLYLLQYQDKGKTYTVKFYIED